MEAIRELKEDRVMNVGEAINSAMQQLPLVLRFEVSSVASVSKREDGWRLTIELIERKAVPDTQDLLGIYDVFLDDEGDMIGYERKSIRRRMDLVETIE